MNTIQIGLLALSCIGIGALAGVPIGRAIERRKGKEHVESLWRSLEPPRPYEEVRGRTQAVRMSQRPTGALYGLSAVEAYKQLDRCPKCGKPVAAFAHGLPTCGRCGWLGTRRNGYFVAQDVIDHALKSPRTYTGRDPRRAWLEEKDE